MVTNPGRQAKKSGAVEVGSQVGGRVQPHSVDFEQALLACCIMEGGQASLDLCAEGKISSASFYLPAHRMLWETIVSICGGGSPINEMILSENLRLTGKLDSIGGIDFINRICDRIDTSAHLGHYVKRVRELELIRRVIASSIANIERAYGETEDFDDFMERAENEIFSISSDRFSECASPIKKSIDSAVNTIQLIRNHRGESMGLISGFTDLDRITFGFKPSEMIVVAARPSLGKTSLAMNIAENVVLPPKGRSPAGVLFFSLEMSSEQLAFRMLCGRAGVNMSKLHDGFVSNRDYENIYTAAKKLQSAPLFIDESTNLTVLEMRAKARRMCSREKIGLIIIDYLQLIGGDNRLSREQQIAEFSRGIKLMAKELKIPVIVLSQLNRESEREKRQPKLSDLRESGAIEQDADLVLLLARQANSDEHGGVEAENEVQSGNNTVLRDLIVAKHRNGPIGVMTLAFVRSLTRFENYAGEKICE
jgi:replicative DNA helicase